MFNLISYIKDIIDLVKNPVGEVSRARELTPEVWQENAEMLEAWSKQCIRKPQIGDYAVTFDRRPDIISICPREEFERNYLIVAPFGPGEDGMNAVISKKPIKL
jgi:hypothetical protein